LHVIHFNLSLTNSKGVFSSE